MPALYVRGRFRVDNANYRVSSVRCPRGRYCSDSLLKRPPGGRRVRPRDPESADRSTLLPRNFEMLRPVSRRPSDSSVDRMRSFKASHRRDRDDPVSTY